MQNFVLAHPLLRQHPMKWHGQDSPDGNLREGRAGREGKDGKDYREKGRMESIVERKEGIDKIV